MPPAVLSLRPQSIPSLNSFQLFWEHSPLWLLPAGLLSILLAWWQYRSAVDFGTGLRTLLMVIRGMVYFIIGLLLLNPLIRYFRENTLLPVSVILIDDSRSVKLSTSKDSLNAFLRGIEAFRKQLESSGNKVFVENLAGPADSLSSLPFNREGSNLEAAIRRIRESYEGRNLAQVVLASDGIINNGSDLQDFKPPFRLHTIALGNPVQARDLFIRDLRCNRIAYLGNQFPVGVDVRGTGLRKNTVNVLLKEGEKILESRLLTLSPSGLAKAEFSIAASKAGIREFSVELEPQEGEITLENNRRVFFVETVRQKQKVLILAASPHPDIKAIRNALEPVEQLEVTSCISGMDDFRPDNYSLVIMHQLPDPRGSFAPQVSRFLQSSEAAIWLFVTDFTDFNRLRNETSAWLKLNGARGKTEESGNRFEDDFQGFQYEEQYRDILAGLPPVKSPGLAFGWKGSSETILRQMIGRFPTPFSLLSIQMQETSRRAIFWGDGLWLWRQNEYGRTENTLAVDNLIRKTARFLLSQQNKKQLQVIGTADEYAGSENPSFRIETFNQLMEPLYDQKVLLQISGKKSKILDYNFITAKGNPPLKISNLPAGIWHYEATAIIDGKELKDEGDFIVRAFDLEARQLVANHSLLKNLARQSGGKFCRISEISKLAVGEGLPPPMLEFTEWNENILSLKFILFSLLFLLGLEWFLRKLNGVL